MGHVCLWVPVGVQARLRLSGIISEGLDVRLYDRPWTCPKRSSQTQVRISEASH